MTFDYLMKSCEIESKRAEKRNLIYLNTILNKLMEYINKQFKENPNQTMKDMNNKVKGLVHDYLDSLSETKVLNKTIEYYLNKGAYSGKADIRKAYDKVYKEDKLGKIDISSLEGKDLRYTYNMQENMENLVKYAIKDIREQKAELKKIEDIDFMMYTLKNKSSKERAAHINKFILNGEFTEEQRRELRLELESGYRIYFKDERDLVEEEIKQYTESAGREVKEDCIKCISKSVQFLDEFGLLEHYTNLNNKNYKKIYMSNVNYPYEEVKGMLTEENLRKLNAEELIIMSSFWTNRVNKIIKDINKALYIVNHKELMHEEATHGEEVIYKIKRQDMKNVDLKMNAIHKLFFELYSGLENDKTKKNVKDITRNLKGIVKRHKDDYKEYFDALFPDSENSLKEDLFISNIFENVRYNSYKIKACNIQALLVSLFNSSSKNIENFGYIQENDGKKKEILIAADIKGYNMTFALHTTKDLVLEFLRSAQGNTKFPVFKNYDDFKLNENEILKAQILVPLTKEVDKQIEEANSRLTPRDRYAKATKHLNYLRKEGKMPEHMMKEQGFGKNKKYKYVREYTDLGENKEVLEK